MKKLFIITLLAVCFVVSILPGVSALSFDNVKSYDAEKKEITITNAFGLGDVLAKIQLIDNTDDCLTECSATFNATIYSDSEDFMNELVFKNVEDVNQNIEYSFKYISSYNIELINDYENVCTSEELLVNGTPILDCIKTQTGSHTEIEEVWSEFNPISKLSGNYIIKLIGYKKPSESVDWIPTFFGKDIDEWAWWNGAWDAKIPLGINFTTSDSALLQNQSVLINVTFESGMKADFGDLRLLNSSETGELGYWFYNDTKIDSNSVQIWVNMSNTDIQQNNTIYLYFNNSGATTTSNIANAFLYGSGADISVGGSLGTWSVNPAGRSWNDKIIVESRIRISTNANNNQWGMDVLSNPSPSGNVAGAQEVGSSSTNTVARLNGGSSTTANANINWNRAEIKINGSTSALATLYSDSRDTTLISRNAPAETSSTFYVHFRHYSDTNPSTGYADWFYVRGYTDTTPNVNYGASIFNSSFITVNLNSPGDNTFYQITEITFNSSILSIQNANLTNATIRIYNSSTSLFNETVNSVSGDSVINESIFTIGNLVKGTYFWNVEFCGITDNVDAENFCGQGVSNFTFDILASEIESGFNDFTYETATETYQSNVTLIEGETISSVNLVYNGTSNSATSTLISGNNYTLSSTIDVPESAVGQNTTQFFFSVNSNLGQTNLSSHNQSVGAINLSIFGQGIGGLPYMKFTFKNETTAQEDVSATFSSTWTYYLGTGAITKTLTFTNASENRNYSFQFHPQNRTLFTDMSVDYNNADSQQRTFDPTTLTLTNNTLSKVLYLLPTANGIFQQFITQSIIGGTITDVNFVINRSIGGLSVQLDSGVTDGSGFASMFLNPDFSHTASFTKTGFADNVFSFQPSSQSRTVVMGTSAISANGSTISTNTNVTILPTNSSLNNGTDYLFSFTVQSTESINLITMNITNLSGYQVGFQTNSGVGTISQTINTGENISFIGVFLYSTDEETITFTKVWNIAVNFEGDYSIFKQLTLYTTYGFEDFIRLMIVIMVILSVLIFMSSTETVDTSESKVAVTVLLIWAFSVVGWLNTGVPVTDSGGFVALSQYGNQYGIAILSTGLATFFMGRRLFT